MLIIPKIKLRHFFSCVECAQRLDISLVVFDPHSLSILFAGVVMVKTRFPSPGGMMDTMRHTQRFLDLCDENGIMVWGEALGPWTNTQDLTNPYFLKYQIQALNEMIDASINNPSVIIWALFSSFRSFPLLFSPFQPTCSPSRAHSYNEGPSNDPMPRHVHFVHKC